MRNKINKQYLAFKYRSNANNSLRVHKNIKNRHKKYENVLNTANSLKEVYGKLDLSCNICNESRCIEFCHIFAVKEGGDSSVQNMLILCPNHHYLFDNRKLRDNEYEKIKPKIEIAASYMETIKQAKASRV